MGIYIAPITANTSEVLRYNFLARYSNFEIKIWQQDNYSDEIIPHSKFEIGSITYALTRMDKFIAKCSLSILTTDTENRIQ